MVVTRGGRQRLDWQRSGREDRRTHASDQVCFGSDGQLKASSYGRSYGGATMVAPGLFRQQCVSVVVVVLLLLCEGGWFCFFNKILSYFASTLLI